jgi:hypothetical protein
MIKSFLEVEIEFPVSDLNEECFMKLNRRQFLHGIAATVAWGGWTQKARARERRPNIVFLLTDDQSYLSLGCMGNAQVKTPQMDRLGAQGVIFDAHYDTTSICMASRATIMTGMYEYKTGCNFSRGSLARALWPYGTSRIRCCCVRPVISRALPVNSVLP